MTLLQFPHFVQLPAAQWVTTTRTAPGLIQGRGPVQAPDEMVITVATHHLYLPFVVQDLTSAAVVQEVHIAILSRGLNR